MIDKNEKLRLIGFLLRMFANAKAEDAKTLMRPPAAFMDDPQISPEQKEEIRQFWDNRESAETEHTVPQACAFLMSTGHMVGGVVPHAVSFHDNPDAPDAVAIAHNALKSSPVLKGDFEIVAIAMTTDTEIDLALYEQSLSELPHLKARNLILVDPSTQQTTYSQHFENYRIV